MDRCNCIDVECRVTDTALPTRVLDIEDLQAIKLRETRGRRDCYVALSHCWGNSKTFLTTHKTIDKMKMGFRIEQAPATFRHAIMVTRSLGIRYLWIDSLCNIQGDVYDWKVESSRMGDVYANSYLTIAAANAKDDAEGFLHPRRAMAVPLKIMSSSGASAQIYLQSQNDQIAVSSDKEEPLDTRG
jgi:hypothetical protein